MKLTQAACTGQINFRGHSKALPQRFQTGTSGNLLGAPWTLT